MSGFPNVLEAVRLGAITYRRAGNWGCLSTSLKTPAAPWLHRQSGSRARVNRVPREAPWRLTTCGRPRCRHNHRPYRFTWQSSPAMSTTTNPSYASTASPNSLRIPWIGTRWRSSMILGMVVALVHLANGREIGRVRHDADQLAPLAILRGDGLYLDRFRPLLRGGERLAGICTESYGHVISRYPVGPRSWHCL